MELDNRMTISGGSNGPDWNKPDATPAEIAAEELAEKQRAIEHEHDNWERQISAANPGDVIVWRSAEFGTTSVMIVQANYSALDVDYAVWGLGMVAGKKHELNFLSGNSSAPQRKNFDGIAALEVISL